MKSYSVIVMCMLCALCMLCGFWMGKANALEVKHPTPAVAKVLSVHEHSVTHGPVLRDVGRNLEKTPSHQIQEA